MWLVIDGYLELCVLKIGGMIDNAFQYCILLYRYLLLELRFSSERDRRHAYSNLTEKSLNQIIKNSILILHGDYGLASVLHSLNGMK